MDFGKLKKVHVIGAGGIGVSAAAKFLLHEGVAITASDLERTVVTDLLASRGATVVIGQRAENVPSDAELVVFSDAVPQTNPERVRARELSIREMTYFQFLGELTRQKRTIAVCGCHGKSTTTAMLGKILEAAGLDPLVIVGALVPTFEDGNLRYGKGEWFVVEACEHRRHFLELSPEIVIATNIEADHLDYYRDLEDVKSAFKEFSARPKTLIWNADDLVSREVFSGGVAVSLADVSDIKLQLPGDHNMIDARLAAAAARVAGAEEKPILEALQNYEGIWRRFERVGEVAGAPIYSDYAHHPTEIRATIQAARELYPDNRLIVAFKPHQHNRTKNLFKEFSRAFDGANIVVIADIYDVAGREEAGDGDVTSEKLVQAIREHNEVAKIHQTVVYKKTNTDVLTFLEETLRPASKGMPSDVVFVMGAGDIDEVARKIV